MFGIKFNNYFFKTANTCHDLKKLKKKSKPTNLQSFNKIYLELYLFPLYVTDDFKVMLATAQLSWDCKLFPLSFYSISSLKSSDLRPPRSIGLAKVCCLRGC